MKSFKFSADERMQTGFFLVTVELLGLIRIATLDKIRLDLIPHPIIQSTSVYPLRNGNDIILPFCRLSATSDSFIPSTIKMWNSLNNNIRNVDTLSKFKSELKKIDETKNHCPQTFFLWSSEIKYYFNSAKKFSFVFEF